MELKNEFSWSVSRNNIFNECKRKYYLEYYQSWGGWFPNADQKTRDTYVLKQLKNKYLWIGSIVHDSIENILTNLKDGNQLDFNIVIENVKKRLYDDWNDSKQGKYWVNPKSYCGLAEDEYYGGIQEDELKSIFSNVVTYLENFYTSKYYKNAKKFNERQWLLIEDFSHFTLSNMKIYTKLDFPYRENNNKIVIIDWKTGKDKGIIDNFQLTCYALFSLERWNIPIENITAIYFFLINKREQIVKMDNAIINAIKGIIEENIDKMVNLLDDEENNIASEENFPQTEDKKICGFCNYKRICFG